MLNVESEVRQTGWVGQQSPDLGPPEDTACFCLCTWEPGSTPHQPHPCTHSEALLTRVPAGCVCMLHGGITIKAWSAQSGAVMGLPLQPLWRQGLGFRCPHQLTQKCRKRDHGGCDTTKGRCPWPARGFSAASELGRVL